MKLADKIREISNGATLSSQEKEHTLRRLESYAEKGFTSCPFEYMSDLMTEYLRNEGFKVERRDNTISIVSW